MKKEKFVLRKVLEILTDNQMKVTTGGSGYSGACYGVNCDTCQICKCVTGVGLWVQCKGAPNANYCDGEISCEDRN